MRAKRSVVIAVVAALVAGVVLVGWSLTGRVTGEVVRARDGRPLEHAVLEVDGHKTPLSGGIIRLRLSLGRQRVEIAAPGYETVRRVVDVSVMRPNSLGVVGLRNADLRVSARQNYPGFPAASGVSVAAGGHAGSRGQRTVTLTDLPVGSTVVTVSAYDCLDATLTVRLKPGANSIVCTLTPTLQSVLERAAKCEVDCNLALAYETMHPVRQRQWGTKAKYIERVSSWDPRDRAGGGSVVGVRVLGSATLSDYRDRPSGQVFREVWRVEMAYTLAYPEEPPPVTEQISYWTQYEGQWRTLGDGLRVEHERKLTTL